MKKLSETQLVPSFCRVVVWYQRSRQLCRVKRCYNNRTFFCFLARLANNSFSSSPHHICPYVILTMPLPEITPEKCVERMKDFESEVDRLSEAVDEDSATIHGDAISNTSLLLINYVKPERFSYMWRLPSNPPDINKAIPNLSEFMDDYMEEFDDIPVEGLPPWKAHFRSGAVSCALDGAISRCLLHYPDRDFDEPLPYHLFEYVITIPDLYRILLVFACTEQ